MLIFRLFYFFTYKEASTSPLEVPCISILFRTFPTRTSTARPHPRPGDPPGNLAAASQRIFIARRMPVTKLVIPAVPARSVAFFAHDSSPLFCISDYFLAIKDHAILPIYIFTLHPPEKNIFSRFPDRRLSFCMDGIQHLVKRPDICPPICWKVSKLFLSALDCHWATNAPHTVISHVV